MPSVYFFVIERKIFRVSRTSLFSAPVLQKRNAGPAWGQVCDFSLLRKIGIYEIHPLFHSQSHKKEMPDSRIAGLAIYIYIRPG